MGRFEPIPFLGDSNKEARIAQSRNREALQAQERSRVSKDQKTDQFNEAFTEARESRSRQEKERLNRLSDEKRTDQKEKPSSAGSEMVAQASPAKNAPSDENVVSVNSMDKAAENRTASMVINNLSLKISDLKEEEGQLKGNGDAALKLASAEAISLEDDLTRMGSLDTEGESFTDFFKSGIDKNMNPNRSIAEKISSVGLQPQEDGSTSPDAQLRAQNAIIERSIVEQVAQKLSLRRFDHSGSEGVTLELTPKELGALKIEISVHKGVVSADILTQHIAVKEILDKNQALLHDALTDSGFNLDHFSVNVGDFSNKSYYSEDNEYYGTSFAYREYVNDFSMPALARAGEILRDRHSIESGISIYI